MKPENLSPSRTWCLGFYTFFFFINFFGIAFVQSATPEVSSGLVAKIDAPVAALIPTNPAINLNQGLVAYYTFEGNGFDISGNANDSTPAGSFSYINDGFQGKSIRINGDNSVFISNGGYVTLPSFDARLNTAFSISMWVKDEVPGSGATDYESYVSIAGSDNSGYRMEIGLLNRGGLNLQFFNGNGSGTAVVGTIPLDQTLLSSWKHVVISISSNRMTGFFNGAVAYESNNSFPFFPANFSALGRHWWPSGSSARMSVTYDNVRIYNRALSPDDAKALNQYEIARRRGLIVHLPFNNNARDESGSNYDAVLTGGKFVSDRFGSTNAALAFDSSTSKQVAVLEGFQIPTNQHTIAFWFKLPTAPNVHGERIVEHGSWGDLSQFSIAAWENGDLECAYAFDNSQSHLRIPNAFKLQKWHLFTVTYQDGVATLFVDGNARKQDQALVRGLVAPLYIGGNPSNTFQLKNAVLDDFYVFDRSLSNEEVKVLYQEGLPSLKILVQPSSVEVVSGQEARFEVAASGISELSYQWRFNGARIIGATNASLVLPRISQFDIGDYSVQVTDGTTTILSESAKLTLFVDSDGDGLSDDFEVGTSRYRLVTGSFTWAQAKADAESKGGHLATITSEAEWQSILSNVGGSFLTSSPWIGGTDSLNEGSWRWVTGEPWGYSRWNAGEPNNSGDEDYLHLNSDGSWNDHPANSVHEGYLFELGYFTDPRKSDTDGDGISDGDEVLKFGTIPTDPSSVPTPILKADRFSTAGGFRMILSGATNLSYVVESSRDFISWTSLATVKPVNGSLTVLDPTATNSAAKFYRVRAVERPIK